MFTLKPEAWLRGHRRLSVTGTHSYKHSEGRTVVMKCKVDRMWSGSGEVREVCRGGCIRALWARGRSLVEMERYGRRETEEEGPALLSAKILWLLCRRGQAGRLFWRLLRYSGGSRSTQQDWGHGGHVWVLEMSGR